MSQDVGTYARSRSNTYNGTSEKFASGYSAFATFISIISHAALTSFLFFQTLSAGRLAQHTNHVTTVFIIFQARKGHACKRINRHGVFQERIEML
ncbi:hypothetical protein N878_07890 [Pseudomonas sp. EGD-AK9]|nr:hypothetical protein N878_07890 [Pseudomonas sp. EGD-AK9]